MKLNKRKMFGALISFIGLQAVTNAQALDCSGARFEVYEGKDGKHRWRLIAGNGEQIAEHAQPYDSKQACLEGIASVRRNAVNAPILENCDSD